MNLLELIDQKNTKVKELRSLVNLAETEKRELTEDENRNYGKLTAQIEQLEKDIESLSNKEGEERSANFYVNTKKNKEDEKRFSLITSIRDYVEGRRFNDVTAEYIKEGRNALTEAGIASRGDLLLKVDSEKRDIKADSNSAIGEDQMSLVMPFYEKSVAIQAGATYLTGVKNDISIPKYSGTQSAWKAEVSASTEGSGSFSELTLSPKRLTTYLDISKQFLNQDSVSANALLQNDMINSIMAKLESTLFGSSSGTTQPSGLFNGKTGTGFTSYSALTWAKVVALESAVDTSNALMGNLAYVTHPSLKGSMKTTQRLNLYNAIMESDQSNGYRVFATSAMAKNIDSEGLYGILFGNFADLIIANWGGLDITIDPYSQSIYGKVRLVINSYWDWVVRRSESFAYGALK